MKPIRWGVIGTGSIASSFVTDAKIVDRALLQGVVSRNASRANSFAQRFGISKSYGDYQELCEDPEIDAVYVATPHNVHAECSVAALRAGKAVLCEKPITVNTLEFDQLAAVARETGGYLMEGLWSYFLPAVMQATEWLRAGRIGRLCHIQADFGFNVPYEPSKRMYSPALAGGTLLDMGIYPLAFAWLAMQRPPAAMHAVGRTAKTGVEDDVTLLYDYGDVTATLTSSMRCRLANRAEWIGTEGRIVMPNFWFASECQIIRDGTIIDRFFEPRSSFGLNYEIDAVCRDIAAGRSASDVVCLDTSRAFQLQLDSIRELLTG